MTSTLPTIDQRTAAEAQVRTLFAPYDSGWIEMRTFAGKHAPAHVYWFPLRQTLDSERDMTVFVDRALDENRSKRDVYIGVLPRAVKRGKKLAIKSAAWFWIDLDDKVFPHDEGLTALQAYGADLVIDTGHGWHGYAKIGSVIDLASVGGDVFERKLRTWQTRLCPDCDPTHDLPRILRLAGTTNWKRPDEPLPVRLVQNLEASDAR